MVREDYIHENIWLKPAIKQSPGVPVERVHLSQSVREFKKVDMVHRDVEDDFLQQRFKVLYMLVPSRLYNFLALNNVLGVNHVCD